MPPRMKPPCHVAAARPRCVGGASEQWDRRCHDAEPEGHHECDDGEDPDLAGEIAPPENPHGTGSSHGPPSVLRATADLGAEPGERVELAVHHPFLERDDAVVGEVDA